MKVSYSRIDCYNQCPYRYYVRYILGLKAKFDYKPDNPLVLGTAMHLGIDKGVDAAIENYFANYPTITERMINEAIKLEILIPKVQKILPSGGEFEIKLEDDDFIGYLDYVVKIPNEPIMRRNRIIVPKSYSTYDVYDFKYSNNKDHYLQCGQLTIYKFLKERMSRDKVRNLYFVFIPKIKLDMNPGESLEDYRERLIAELDKAEISIEKVEYDPNKVIDFLIDTKHCAEEQEFNKNKTACWFCDYKKYCQSNGADLSEIEIKEE